MRAELRALGIACVMCLVATVVVGAVSVQAADCPRDIQCPDVWNPVICSNGQVYSNDCYAYRDCATGCVPLGPGPLTSAASESGMDTFLLGCPRLPPGCYWNPGSNCTLYNCI